MIAHFNKISIGFYLYSCLEMSYVLVEVQNYFYIVPTVGR